MPQPQLTVLCNPIDGLPLDGRLVIYVKVVHKGQRLPQTSEAIRLACTRSVITIIIQMAIVFDATAAGSIRCGCGIQCTTTAITAGSDNYGSFGFHKIACVIRHGRCPYHLLYGWCSQVPTATATASTTPTVAAAAAAAACLIVAKLRCQREITLRGNFIHKVAGGHNKKQQKKKQKKKKKLIKVKQLLRHDGEILALRGCCS